MQQNNKNEKKDPTKLLSTTSLTSSNFNYRSKTLVGFLFCASFIHYILQGWDFNLSWKFSLISLAVFMDMAVIVSSILLLNPERTNFHFSGNELKFEGLAHIVTNIINLGLQNLLSPLLTLVFAERGKEAAKITIEGMVGVAMSFNILETWLYLHYYEEARAIEFENNQLALRKIRVLAHNTDIFVTTSLQTLSIALYSAMSWGLLEKIKISDKNRLTVIENLDYGARLIAWAIRLTAINNIALAAEIIADSSPISWSLKKMGFAGFEVKIVQKSEALKQVEKFFNQLKEILRLVHDFGEKIVKKAINAIEDLANDAFNKIGSFLQDVKDGKILSLIEDGFAQLKESLENTHQIIVKSLEATKLELQNQLNNIASDLANKVSQLSKLIEENVSLKIFKESLEKEYQLLKEGLSTANQKIKDFTENAQKQAEEILKQLKQNTILKNTVDECKAIEAKLWENWRKLKQEKKDLQKQMMEDLTAMRKAASTKIKAIEQQISSTLIKGFSNFVEDIKDTGEAIATSIGITTTPNKIMIDRSTQTDPEETDLKKEYSPKVKDESTQTAKQLERSHSSFLDIVDPLHVFHNDNKANEGFKERNNNNKQKKEAETESKQSKTDNNANEGKKHALNKDEESTKQNNSKITNYFDEYKIKEVSFALETIKKQNKPYNQEKEQEIYAKEVIKNLMQDQAEQKKYNYSEMVETNDYYKTYNLEVPLLVLDTKFPIDAW